MPYIPPETVEKLRDIYLLTYMQNYEPNEIVKISAGNYCTKTHSSLKISDGKWNWFHAGIGGVNALDYLIKVEGYSFTSAAEILMGRVAITFPKPVKYEEKKKVFILPDACKGMEKCRKYLRSRGISQKVISYCIQTGKLYESLPHHNAVFVGYDRTGEARYAFQRGLGTDFRGDVAGSDKRYAFSLQAMNPSKVVYVFESAIDLLSFATLLEKAGKDFRAFNLLSVEGVHMPKKETAKSKLPLALSQYLKDNPDTEKLVFCFDNDIVGRYAAAMVTTLLPDYEVKAKFPPAEYKDMNDFLTGKKTMKKEQEKTSIR